MAVASPAFWMVRVAALEQLELWAVMWMSDVSRWFCEISWALHLPVAAPTRAKAGRMMDLKDIVLDGMRGLLWVDIQGQRIVRECEKIY